MDARPRGNRASTHRPKPAPWNAGLAPTPRHPNTPTCRGVMSGCHVGGQTCWNGRTSLTLGSLTTRRERGPRSSIGGCSAAIHGRNGAGAGRDTRESLATQPIRRVRPPTSLGSPPGMRAPPSKPCPPGTGGTSIPGHSKERVPIQAALAGVCLGNLVRPRLRPGVCLVETSYSCTCEKTLPAPAVGRPEPEGAVMSSSRAAEVAARRRRLSQMGAMSKNDDAAATASATVSPAMAR